MHCIRRGVSIQTPLLTFFFFPVLGYIPPLFENDSLIVFGGSCSFVLTTLIFAISNYMKIKPFGFLIILM